MKPLATSVVWSAARRALGYRAPTDDPKRPAPPNLLDAVFRTGDRCFVKVDGEWSEILALPVAEDVDAWVARGFGYYEAQESALRLLPDEPTEGAS